MARELVFFREVGEGPPLLLIHGLMVSGDMFTAAVVDHFAARFRVIVPDLRGHGRSRALGSPYHAAQLALDLAELLDSLSVTKAAVLGYSQGGAIAQQLALDHPQLCARLVLACTYAFNMASRREWLEGHMVPPLLRVLGTRRFAQLVVSQGAKHLGADLARWLGAMMADQDKALMAAAWRETIAFDSRKRLGAIACPTLVVAGAADNAVPMHHAEMLRAGIPDARLAVVAGGDHALIWTHPQEFLGAVDPFLVGP